jgi:hypothetical protein
MLEEAGELASEPDVLPFGEVVGDLSKRRRV